jgi:hypothetical protein
MRRHGGCYSATTARPPKEETFQDRRTLEIGGERKHLISGHVGRFGTRDDVKLHQQYMADISETSRNSITQNAVISVTMSAPASTPVYFSITGSARRPRPRLRLTGASVTERTAA